jgi:hypothetical protein
MEGTMKYVTLSDDTYEELVEALEHATSEPPDGNGEEPPEPPPSGGDCGAAGDCQYLNPKCVTSGFWKGWCVDELVNFRGTGTEGQMNHNANCLRRPPRLDKLGIRFGFDVKFDVTWLTNTVARGQHLGGVWAAFGDGKTRDDWVERNLRVDFSRQAPDGFDVVIHGYKDGPVVMDTRQNTRLAGVYVPNQWRRTVVTAHYDPALGRVHGTVEYVGVGTKGFDHTDSDVKGFPVFWNWAGFGNVDTGDPHVRADFGVTFRNVTIESL